MKPVIPSPSDFIHSRMGQELYQTLTSLFRHLRGMRAQAIQALALCFPFAASAQSRGGFFDELGSKGVEIVCGFIYSPVTTIVLIAILVGLLIAISAGEENSGMTKTLKFFLCGVAILAIPKLMIMLGFELPGGSACRV